MTHWLLVGSEDNFNTTKAHGFSVAGMKTRWKKAAGEVRPGDTVFFYLTGLQVIAGECRVTAEAYYDDAVKIWDCTTPGEMYPWRLPTEPVLICTPNNYLPVKDFIAAYTYANKWPPNRATLAFQGNVHRLPGADYQLIHALLAAKAIA